MTPAGAGGAAGQRDQPAAAVAVPPAVQHAPQHAVQHHVHHPAPAPLVLAAGAVCWTRARGRLEVLLVHRPKYRDWSYPKGKLDPGEGTPEAAVREVVEETGVQVRLGVPLPRAHYPLSPGQDKQVTYWAAHVPDGVAPDPPRPREVDRTEWVDAAEAQGRLTRRGDRLQLKALVDADAGGALATWPLLVVRHGHAHPKTVWAREDADRPLVAAGERQAAALAATAWAWAPDRVVCSPWERCLATVRPYLAVHPVPLKTKGSLSEDGHRREPAKAARVVGKLLAKGRPVMVCTHRPVLSTVLGTLAGNASVGVADQIPRTDPYLAPGEVLVAHVSTTRGRVVAVERHLPVLR